MKAFEFVNDGIHEYVALLRVDGGVVAFQVECRNLIEARRIVTKLFGSSNVLSVREVMLGEYGAANAKSNWSNETWAVDGLMKRGKRKSEEADAKAEIGQTEIAATMKDEAQSLKRQGRALRARNGMNKNWHELMKNQPGAKR